MEQTKVWHVSNNDYYLQDITSTIGHLEKGVYELQFNSLGGPFLHKRGNEFEFDFKIYGLEEEFINKAINTYKHTKGNLGILFNGVKGTGKTITAEIIANKLELPVILITGASAGVNPYLAAIPQDIVVFIDEYEKVYKSTFSWNDEDSERNAANADSSLLSLMDGVLKDSHRKVFLLTTNKVWINENMLNRPGRIRYLKHFTDLSVEQIQEILDDCLIYKEWAEAIFDFIKPLKLITVDIIKAIVSEVNIYNETPEKCCKDLNIEFKDDTYNIYKINKPTKTKKATDILYMENIPAKVISPFLTKIKQHPKAAQLNTDYAGIKGVSAEDDNLFTVYDSYYGSPDKPFQIKVEKVRTYHNSFIV